MKTKNLIFGAKEMIQYLTINEIDVYGVLRNWCLIDCLPASRMLSELEIKEIEHTIGKMKMISQNEEKDDGQCIRTTIAHFCKHSFYIKEIAIGECHYEDVCIDGLPDEVSYFEVEPKEVLRVEYFERMKV